MYIGQNIVTFNDISGVAWAGKYIKDIVAKGIVSGDSNERLAASFKEMNTRLRVVNVVGGKWK